MTAYLTSDDFDQNLLDVRYFSGRVMVGYGGGEEGNGRQLTASDYSQAGLISGIATRCIIQPLDVLKIRFQLQEEPLHGLHKGKYSGIVQALFLIRKEEGMTAFWKGHVPAQGLSAIYGLVQFTSFEMLTSKAVDIPLALAYRGVTDFVCGAVAGCCAMTTAMPLDVIRTRLVAQGEPKVYRGTLHAAFCIWRFEGLRGYFRGLSPSLAQIAPYTGDGFLQRLELKWAPKSQQQQHQDDCQAGCPALHKPALLFLGIQFALYNWFNDIWRRFICKYETTGALICGALAGTASKTLLYPLDMIRHRLQMRGFKRRGFGKTTQCRTMIGTFVHVTQHESALGLFKGLWPSMLKAAANSGFAFLFYELALDLIRAL
uniref:Mitochondrial thiamine pyrophosphate carrier n=1 Tax=Ascaris lumbricoides TaxID=6252 RepID=A0A0M3HRH2_ASCLU